MENTITFVISVLMGGFSIALAIFAIWMSKVTERESRANYEKTKEALADIRETAAVIGSTVSDNQKQLLDAVTDILRETTVPQKEDVDQQIGIVLLQALINDPEKFMKIMPELQSMAERNQRNN